MAVSSSGEDITLDLLITQVGPVFEHVIPPWPVISVQLRRIAFQVLTNIQQKFACGFIRHDPVLDSCALPLKISCPTTSRSFFTMNAKEVSYL